METEGREEREDTTEKALIFVGQLDKLPNKARTVIRNPRMQGFPPHFPGSTVIRSNAPTVGM